MVTILKGLGILALVGGVLLAIVVFVVVLKIRRFLAGLRGMAASTPATIQLRPTGAPAWTDAGRVERLCRPLMDRGFVDAGTYTIPAMAGLVLRGLVHEKD